MDYQIYLSRRPDNYRTGLFFRSNISRFSLIAVFVLFFCRCTDNQKNTGAEQLIKAYNIDYNWGPGGAHGFARPGLWADANPDTLMKWYEDMGCNVVHSFGVSCNGYAWYKNGIVPEQPGLKYDFLTRMVQIGRKKGIKVFGYFCMGANNKWEEDHSKEYVGSDMLHEVDWLTNEAGDMENTRAVRKFAGSETKLITCLAKWNKQNPATIVPAAINEKIGLYGFTRPVNGWRMLPVGYYLSNPVDSLKGDERNIAVLARVYNNLPVEYVKK